MLKRQSHQVQKVRSDLLESHKFIFSFWEVNSGKKMHFVPSLFLKAQVLKASWTNDIWMSKRLKLINVRSNCYLYMGHLCRCNSCVYRKCVLSLLYTVNISLYCYVSSTYLSIRLYRCLTNVQTEINKCFLNTKYDNAHDLVIQWSKVTAAGGRLKYNCTFLSVLLLYTISIYSENIHGTNISKY